MKRLLILSIIAMLFLCSCSGSESKEVYQLDLSQKEIDISGLSLTFDDLISVTKGPDNNVVIKAKIKPGVDKESTIRKNYHNVCDLITKNGFDACSEIQYWAVADMTNGEESKVIQFTVDKNTIENIKNEKIFATQLEDYVDGLFIHPSLR